MLHCQLNHFSTILIAPSLNSLEKIRTVLLLDNAYRKADIDSGKPDPG